jgi:predicted RNase H-like HicB family nuclease
MATEGLGWYNGSILVLEVEMKSYYTAKYTPIESGYMGQIVEWPEVVTEGKTIDECRSMLTDALREMLLAYTDLKREPPLEKALFEQIPIEV